MKTTNLGSKVASGAYDRVDLILEQNVIAIQYLLTGDPTAVTVDFEGSLDGGTWGVIETKIFSAGELTALSAFNYIVDKPVPYFRINVSTLSFTTSGTIEAIIRYEDS